MIDDFKDRPLIASEPKLRNFYDALAAQSLQQWTPLEDKYYRLQPLAKLDSK
jgi:hypothetical protein